MRKKGSMPKEEDLGKKLYTFTITTDIYTEGFSIKVSPHSMPKGLMEKLSDAIANVVTDWNKKIDALILKDINKIAN